MIDDVQARAILAGLAPDLSANALDMMQAVARFETGYGNKWAKTAAPCDQGADQNNWGAIKSGKKATGGAGAWVCDAGAFPCFDEDKVTPDCFRTYLTPEAGAKAMVDLLLKMKHVGDLLRGGGGTAGEMAHAMKQDGYYTAGEAGYAKNLNANLTDMRAALGTQPSGRGKIVAAVGGGLALVGGVLLGWRFSR